MNHENIDDEIEADLNGLLIYLGLGYPRIEGYQAFLDVFQVNPTEANKTAYCLTFINARHWDAFKVYTPDFRTWLNDTHNITYTHEAHSDMPYEIAEKNHLNGAGVSHEGHNMNYEVAKHKAFLEDLPTSRGFEFN